MTRHALACSSAVLALAYAALAQTDGFTPVRLTPQELEWKEGANGVTRAVVSGDDTKPGMYAYRTRFAPNRRVEPHFHPDDRVVVVVSGTLYVGFGSEFDERALKALPPGSTWTEPKGQPHYAWAKDGEVVIHVVGVGPSGTTPASPPQ